MNEMSKNPADEPAGLLRRLAAALYDAMLLFAVLFLATAPLLFFTHGEALPGSDLAYRIYLLGVAFLFFGWFWTHGGQTLGMRAWRIRVLKADGGNINWLQALQRFFGAMVSWLPCGLGYLWLLLDPERRTWHDRMSRSRVVFEPKKKPRGGA